MSPTFKFRAAAGTPSPGMRFTIGEMSEKGINELIEGPAACTFWEPGAGANRQGVLYRDPRRGLTIRTAASWDPNQTFGPITIDIPILVGRLADGHFFSLHDVRVTSSLHQSEIDAAIGYLGAWVSSANPTFDNLTIWIDQLPRLLGDHTYNLYRSGELLPPPRSKTAGKMTVTPERNVTTSRHSQRGHAYRLELQYSQPRKLDWWLHEWVNPLTRLVSLCVGEPATPTMIATKINREAHGDHEHHSHLYITGPGWPTLDLTALEPPHADHRSPPLLLGWHDQCFDLRTLMRKIRSVETKLDVPFTNYLETIYADLRPNHEFLDLVQAAESFHSRTEGRYKTAGTTTSDELLKRLKAKGVNNPDRTKIRRALQALSPNEYSLSERLAAMANGPGLPPPPSTPPPWIPAAELPEGHRWADWIGRARNDISHGNATIPIRWLGEQNLYLRALIERGLLQQLGLPRRHCDAAATRRYNHAR